MGCGSIHCLTMPLVLVSTSDLLPDKVGLGGFCCYTTTWTSVGFYVTFWIPPATLHYLYSLTGLGGRPSLHIPTFAFTAPTLTAQAPPPRCTHVFLTLHTSLGGTFCHPSLPACLPSPCPALAPGHTAFLPASPTYPAHTYATSASLPCPTFLYYTSVHARSAHTFTALTTLHTCSLTHCHPPAACLLASYLHLPACTTCPYTAAICFSHCIPFSLPTHSLLTPFLLPPATLLSPHSSGFPVCSHHGSLVADGFGRAHWVLTVLVEPPAADTRRTTAFERTPHASYVWPCPPSFNAGRTTYLGATVYHHTLLHADLSSLPSHLIYTPPIPSPCIPIHVQGPPLVHPARTILPSTWVLPTPPGRLSACLHLHA